ncbi:signal peptidase I [Frigoribacterium sp. PvP032]|uniref:signal peptidase I n=1 Tax=Frigoribacterium sp. PvP032 TaxID=2806589 RepID=UPI001B4DFD8B|nr:signal peptidase I [Frigoribacterium sp. PvP032]MBP1190408.1 signal peptidase [Frigoribacterium sp. PvP032]
MRTGRERTGRESADRENTGLRGLARALLLGLSIGALGLVVALAALLVVVPKATGSTPLTVLTSSMEPTFPPGTLVVVRPVDTDLVEPGDVLTYQLESGEAAVVTHRVVEVVSTSDGMRSFVMRGDANGSVDADPVMPVQVKGAVWYSLPLVGWVAQAVGGEGRGWVATAVGVVLCLYSVVALGTGVRRRRRAGAAETGHGRRAAGAR